MRLVRTTTFRLALTYLVLFSVSTLVVLAFVYWTVSRTIATDLEDTIDDEAAVLIDAFRLNGLDTVTSALEERAVNPHLGRHLYALVDTETADPSASNGPLVLAGNLRTWPIEAVAPNAWIDFEVTRPDVDRPILARGLVVELSPKYRLLIGQNLASVIEFKRTMLETMIGALVVTGILGGIGGYVMSRRALRRVDSIGRTVDVILSGDLSQRIPNRGTGDELDRLADRLNNMLERIEALIVSMREVTDNVAHDLRTPLARLRSQLEIALMHKTNESEYRDALHNAIAQSDGIINTFNALLSLAQIESGALRDSLGAADLSEIARDAAEFYEPLAEEKQLDFTVVLDPALVVRGDRHLLSQMIGNLLDNAIKYSPKGGRVSLSMRGGNGAPTLVIADSGPGIPKESRERALARFTRLESSRHTAGAGLGLSMAAAISKLHDAELQLDDNAPGLRVTVRFPRPVGSSYRSVETL